MSNSATYLSVETVKNYGVELTEAVYEYLFCDVQHIIISILFFRKEKHRLMRSPFCLLPVRL
jgi:hypothetical protein